MTTANIRFAKQRMLAPVYRRAAQKIERGDTRFACFAIAYSSRGVLRTSAVKHFENLYMEDALASRTEADALASRTEAYAPAATAAWMSNVINDLPKGAGYAVYRQYKQDCRIVALCFAAAMAQTGDLP